MDDQATHKTMRTGPSSALRALSVDEAIDLAGGFGRYQLKMMSLMALAYMACSVNMFLPVFLESNVLEIWTDVTPIQAQSLGSFFFLGFWVGLFILGSWADRAGRRKVIIVSLMGMIITTCATFLINSMTMMIVTRVAAGFATSGAFNSAIVIVLESVPSNWRVGSKALLAVFWDVALLTYAVAAYLLRNASWRYLIVMNAYSVLGFLLTWLLLSESTRFLLAQVSHERATQAVLEMAQLNGKSSNFLFSSTDEPNFRLRSPQHADTRSASFFALWKPRVAVLTLAIGFAQFAGTMAFYGLTLSNDVHVTENEYMNTILGAFAEVPGIVVTWLAAERFGRRITYAAILGTLGVALVGASLDSLGGVATGILILVGRFAAAGATMICYVVSAECFPTDCRSAGVAWGSSCGRLGAILAPLTFDLPFGVVAYSVINLLAMVSTAALIPETLGKRMDSHNTNEEHEDYNEIETG